MTYGIPHTVRGWDPTDIVTTVDIDEYDLSTPEGFTAVILSGTESGPVILVPTVALTPVDTTPAEPEPGAWLIGESVVMGLARPGLMVWLYDNPDGSLISARWPALWKALGGPGITPRRLVPEPEPVTFPWIGGPEQEHVVDVVTGGVVDGGDLLGADLAETKGWALISAARAAREVKP